MSYLMAVLSLMAAPEFTVEELVQAHDTAITLVHAFDASFELSECLAYDVEKQLAKKLDSPRRDLTCRWTVDDTRERLFYRAHTNVQKVDDILADRGVTVADNNTMRTLLNWSEESPPRITPNHQGPVRGMITPRMDRAPGFPSVTASFLRNIPMGLDVPGIQLMEAIRAFEKVDIAKSAKTEGQSGHIYTIRAEQPRAGNHAISMAIDLDSSVGFLVRRIDVMEEVEFVGRRRVLREIKSFHDSGEGVFFPELVEQIIWLPDKSAEPTSRVVTRVTSLDVNRSVPPTLLTLPFPKDLLVGIHGLDGTYELKLWGADDQPGVTIHDMKELGLDSPPSSASASWIVLGLLGGACVFVMFCVLAVRARNRNRGV